MMLHPLRIEPVRGSKGLRDWLSVPGRVYCGEPGYIEALRQVERDRISRKHNSFFSYGDAAFFLAYRGGMPLGRISAQVNNKYLAHHDDATGQFGFFDCADDPEAAQALVDAATRWLSDRGMRRLCGPFSLSINQETGLLVSGFSSPPAILMSHAAAWSGALLEGCGLAKVVDLLAYRMRPQNAPREIERLAGLARNSTRIVVRNIAMPRFADEARLIFDIFNDAWSENWGFVPVGPEDVAAIVHDMRPIMRSKFGFIAEVDGQPAAMLVVLPDINGTIAPFHGRLLPFNWARLAYSLYADRWKTARIPLLGIRKAYRGSALASAILSLLVSDALALGRSYDLDWVEFSWILETNRPMINLANLAAVAPDRVYRIYEKSFASAPAVE